MKFAVLSDAHGNLEYFNKCIEYIKNEKIDTIFYLGDIFGYLDKAFEVLQKLRQINAKCILGNHDAMVLGILTIDDKQDEIYRHKDEIKKINNEDKQFLAGLSPFYTQNIDSKRILFVHGSPYNPLNGYMYEDDKNIHNIINLPYDVIFMGHTHRPFIKKIDDKIVVNVGSCGLPRDFGNKPSFVICDNGIPKIIRLEIGKEFIVDNYKHLHIDVYNCLLREEEKYHE